LSSEPIFDAKASTYDSEFSQSFVGSVQRKMIHDFVGALLKGKKDLDILELNCGTGEDALFLSQFGNLTISDVSGSMLEVARKKNPGINAMLINLNQPLPTDKKYDLIFSNFGGFNCISKERLMKLDTELHQILNPNGRLIIVFMSKWSLVEFIYFSLRLNFKKAFRRIKGKSYYGKLPIYYYSQETTEHIFSSFNLQSKLSVGKLLSGEYMNKWAPKLGVKESLSTSPNALFGADHILFNFIRRE
jgi:ubiquinone/menaquinone biosynthesis C-methylase UbiE